MSWLQHAEVIVVVIGATDPKDAEWRSFTDCLMRLEDMSRARILLYTDGGVPNAAHRKMLGDVLDGATPSIAIVGDGAAVRGAGIAISWINRAIAVFTPDNLGAALDYLGLKDGRRNKALELARLCAIDIEVRIPHHEDSATRLKRPTVRPALGASQPPLRLRKL
jgi:hypothetical protein